jgi:hypothetical protein
MGEVALGFNSHTLRPGGEGEISFGPEAPRARRAGSLCVAALHLAAFCANFTIPTSKPSLGAGEQLRERNGSTAERGDHTFLLSP